jgi:hypothetical protein
VYNKTEVNDPIGLAQYGIDTYPSRRIWLRRDGKILVGIEGKMFIGGNRGPTNVPYPIPYRAITPRADKCSNLLVPVCFSATHLGYASARMEPVFMICGESAGIAACRALAENTTVQKIDMAAYRRTLEKAGQKLTWDPAPIGVSFHWDTLQRKGKRGDNWCMTWAADDNLYTMMDDGIGCNEDGVEWGAKFIRISGDESFYASEVSEVKEAEGWPFNEVESPFGSLPKVKLAECFEGNVLPAARCPLIQLYP